MPGLLMIILFGAVLIWAVLTAMGYLISPLIKFIKYKVNYEMEEFESELEKLKEEKENNDHE